jgi:hypothetical protein
MKYGAIPLPVVHFLHLAPATGIGLSTRGQSDPYTPPRVLRKDYGLTL